MSEHVTPSENPPVKNADRELYREGGGDGNGQSYYEPSIHVTEHGAIGMNVGGHVITASIRGWHEMATGRDALVAQARDEGIRQAIEWLRADYEYGTGPDWREDGAAWIEDRAADERIRAKVERSSLGTPAAKAARESVSDETARRVVARADEIRRSCIGCGKPLDEHPAGPPCPPPPPPGTSVA